jgi:hypothetical protein
LKNVKDHIIPKLALFCLSFFTYLFTSAQYTGRVVINEYMPWTSNGCGTTAEFVELMNFGPGPVNIGCYVLTDGDFSITIPPGTILQVGEFYVISGQSTIPKPCANTTKNVTVDLNWNTCGCTSGPIPTTGDGFFTDGGAANEQVVLLSPWGAVVDAVARSLPIETSSLITTSSAGGACTSYSFDLDNMGINYEIIGESAGRGNSFARKLDGDCGWLKDTQQSADATNNTSGGTTSDITYEFNIVDAQDCGGLRGSIDVYVRYNDYSSVFPMNYIIAYDLNNNGTFDLSDQYYNGVDNTPPSVYINALQPGRYRVTIGSANGCFLRSFDFTILPCEPPLPVKLLYFKEVQANHRFLTFEWKINEMEKVSKVVLEKSRDGYTFETAYETDEIAGDGSQLFSQSIPFDPLYHFYRLQVVCKGGKNIVSALIKDDHPSFFTKAVWPNPAKDKITLSLPHLPFEEVEYVVYGVGSSLVKKGKIKTNGERYHTLWVKDLPVGIYQIAITNTSTDGQPILYRFVKH